MIATAPRVMERVARAFVTGVAAVVCGVVLHVAFMTLERRADLYGQGDFISFDAQQGLYVGLIVAALVGPTAFLSARKWTVFTAALVPCLILVALVVYISYQHGELTRPKSLISDLVSLLESISIAALVATMSGTAGIALSRWFGRIEEAKS